MSLYLPIEEFREFGGLVAAATIGGTANNPRLFEYGRCRRPHDGNLWAHPSAIG